MDGVSETDAIEAPLTPESSSPYSPCCLASGGGSRDRDRDRERERDRDRGVLASAGCGFDLQCRALSTQQEIVASAIEIETGAALPPCSGAHDAMERVLATQGTSRGRDQDRGGLTASHGQGRT